MSWLPVTLLPKEAAWCGRPFQAKGAEARLALPPWGEGGTCTISHWLCAEQEKQAPHPEFNPRALIISRTRKRPREA